MKKLLLNLIGVLISLNSFVQDLLHYMTTVKKETYKTYQPPFINSDDVNPPPTNVRTMAEWEEFRNHNCMDLIHFHLKADCWLCSGWRTRIYCLQRFEFSKDISDKRRRAFGKSKFIKTSFNSVWCRDYGPWAVYSGISDSLKQLTGYITDRDRLMTLCLLLLKLYKSPNISDYFRS